MARFFRTLLIAAALFAASAVPAESTASGSDGANTVAASQSRSRTKVTLWT